MKKLQQIKISNKLKPIEILRQYGHIVKTRDGYFLKFFTNSLGEFLFFEDSIGVELVNFDENLLYNKMSFHDIVEIYSVKDCVYFFGKDLSLFKNRLNMIEQGILNDDGDIIGLVYKRE